MAARTEFAISSTEPTVTMSRVFDAPRALVYRALTEPAYKSRWYGPHGYEVVSCEMAVRVGGAYRIVQRSPDGDEFGFHGEYREVVSPSRLVYTWIFEGMPDKVAVTTDVLEEEGERTRWTATTRFETLADRDGFVATGAEHGARESIDRLDAVLASMA